jgi:hypothetical protein
VSKKRDFYRILDQAAHDPELTEVLVPLLALWLKLLTPISEATRAGDHDRAAELVEDWEAKALLQSALPDWEWGDCGDGAHLDAGGRHFTGWV